MKRILILLLAGAGLFTSASAQTASSGRIHFEVTQKTDMSQVRVVIDGQQIKPGSPDFPTDIPDSRSFAMTLSFAGNYAKEERENNATRFVSGGPGTVPQTTNLGRPYEETQYLDLKARSGATLLTLKEGETATTYRTDTPFGKTTGWQETTQTKKIAGYACRKATVPYQKETYTVWYTTDLPFTYSPVRDLTPEKGVVLALESSREQFRATKVELKPVAEADVRPAATAQVVTPDQLRDLRDKARANFRQRMVDRANGN